MYVWVGEGDEEDVSSLCDTGPTHTHARRRKDLSCTIRYWHALEWPWHITAVSAYQNNAC